MRNRSSRGSGIFLVVSLLIILIVVIVLGVIKDKKQNEVIVQLNAEYVEENQSKKDEEDKTAYPIEGENLLFLGDNISSINKYQDYVSQVSKVNINTIATDGIQLGEVIEGLTSNDLVDIDKVIVFAGTNDYGEDKPLGVVTDSSEAETFFGSLEKVIKYIRNLNPDIEMIFITPLKRGAFADQVVYPNYNYAGYLYEDYISAIKETCNYYEINVIDAFNNSGIDENNIYEYTIDNLNLNDQGAKILGEFIGKQLNEIYAEY
mgnify:CR=1 FL=1